MQHKFYYLVYSNESWSDWCLVNSLTVHLFKNHTIPFLLASDGARAQMTNPVQRKVIEFAQANFQSVWNCWRIGIDFSVRDLNLEIFIHGTVSGSPEGTSRNNAFAGSRPTAGCSHSGVHIRTIERLVHLQQETGRVNDRPRNGRPRVATSRQDRFITFTHLRNRQLTATETANNTIGSHNRHIHPDTIRNRLRVNGLRAWHPYVGVPLTHARR